MGLHELSKDGQWEEMTELVTADMVDAFAIEAPPDELADEILDKYGGIADRIQLAFDGSEYWNEVLMELKS